MTRSDVHASYEAIEDFAKALYRFADVAQEKLRHSDSAIRLAVAELEERRSALRREIAQLRNDIESAEDDLDVREAERRMEEAEDALARVRRAQRNLEASIRTYKREAQRLDELTTTTTRDAMVYLRSVISDLRAYFAAEHGGWQPAAGGFGSAVGEASASGVAVAAGTVDPTSFALPAGFRWIPLSAIDLAGELADVKTEEDFKKVSYADVRKALDLLHSEILPALDGITDASGTFARLDALNGVPYAKSLQRVYDAFFGADSVYLSRGPEGSLFSITNGRHRIRAAADAGWTAVPARTSDGIRNG